jgi:hypothetical protein
MSSHALRSPWSSNLKYVPLQASVADPDLTPLPAGGRVNMPILKARAVAGVIAQAITVAVIVVAGEADEAFAEGVRGSGPREKVRTSIERCRELRAHFHQRQRALFRSERENFLMGSRVARSKLNSGVAQIALQALQQRGAFMSPSSDDSNAVSKIGRINILRILELTVEKTPLCQFAFSPRHSLYFDAAVAASGARSYRRKCVVG